jgi:quercetin dioxygenase-like cupin family protein
MGLAKNPTTGLVVELFGPTLEFLILPDDEQSDFCVLKGTIPPGFSVPLHSHPDTEDFLLISGALEGLRHDGASYTWIGVNVGDYIHVPANARHAWRNVSGEPVINLIFTTKRLGRFFQEVGRPVAETPQPPTFEELERFVTISAQYGHWNATPEENEAVGLQISFK